jgi:hypothetical protein
VDDYTSFQTPTLQQPLSIGLSNAGGISNFETLNASPMHGKSYLGASGIGVLQTSSNLGGGINMTSNQVGKSTLNIRKPLNVPAPAVTDYQVGGATINSRHDEASASPVRGNGPTNNSYEFFELQQ